MFRIKRSVTAQYATIMPLISFTKSKDDIAKDKMQLLEGEVLLIFWIYVSDLVLIY
jgi:hypothetical protein